MRSSQSEVSFSQHQGGTLCNHQRRKQTVKYFLWVSGHSQAPLTLPQVQSCRLLSCHWSPARWTPRNQTFYKKSAWGEEGEEPVVPRQPQNISCYSCKWCRGLLYLFCICDNSRLQSSWVSSMCATWVNKANLLVHPTLSAVPALPVSHTSIPFLWTQGLGEWADWRWCCNPAEFTRGCWIGVQMFSTIQNRKNILQLT